MTLTSIIILTHNGLAFTKECVSSILRHTKDHFEFVFVDNASTDETQTFLKSIPHSKIIENETNVGFPKGCNQGFQRADGENIILLNNDTVVTDGWMSRLLYHLNAIPNIGIVGPRSNIIVPHQAIRSVHYRDLEQMERFAEEWSKVHNRKGFPAEHLSGMCMAFKRSLIDKIGGMDEQFSPGYFEDTDFSLRTRIANKELWVADDVYIHHYGSSSFRKTHPKRNSTRLNGDTSSSLPLNRSLQNKTFNDSRQKFLSKWNITDVKEIGETANREKPFNSERHYVPF